ncbi:hypothetical protein [Pseudoduganella rhizocola]|uniref:hypothetical protein n=1 Tax=Pseudoduganella rhizocola TaxID=3382643 RepID=UPI0038B60118
MKKLPLFLAFLLMVCAWGARAEVKILSYTAVIAQVFENTDTGQPAPGLFVIGTTITSRWILESGAPDTPIRVHATDTMIGGQHLWSQGGIGGLSGNSLYLTSGPFMNPDSSAEWDYAGWSIVEFATVFRGPSMNGLPPHRIPTLAQLLATPPDMRTFGLTVQRPEGPDDVWYTAVAHLSAFTLETVPPVPEPDAWLLMLGGAVAFGLLRVVRKSGLRSAGSS